jgi:GT2 family glycosyltransferase
LAASDTTGDEGHRGGGRPSDALPLVVSVVVNYRGAADTVQCVRSLLASAYGAHRVVVVDNDSGDDDVETIRREFGDRIELVRASRNLGYGGAANLGIQLAIGEGAVYAWILNNDTIVQPDAVDALVRAMETDRLLGAASPEIEASPGPEAPTGVWYAGGTFRLSRAETSHEFATLGRTPRVVLTQLLTGCAILLRCEALGDAEVFWERLFLYWEDVDLSLRLHAGGWSLGVVPTAIITHFPHASIPSGVATPLNFRNAILVARRNSSTTVVATAVAFLGSRLARAWGSALLRRRPSPVTETRRFASGVWLALRWTIRRPSELRLGIRPADALAPLSTGSRE